MKSQKLPSQVISLKHDHGTLVGNFSTTKAGTLDMLGYILYPGEFSATYYTLDLNDIWANKVNATIDFSAAPGTKPFPSLPGDSPYSIRWSGFVRPPVASVYT
eukprot:764901-Hanusia_phi.AAC.1